MYGAINALEQLTKKKEHFFARKQVKLKRREMVKATDVSVSNMCWTIWIFGSIWLGASVDSIAGYDSRPNIVVVLTDDQDITLNGMVN